MGDIIKVDGYQYKVLSSNTVALHDALNGKTECDLEKKVIHEGKSYTITEIAKEAFVATDIVTINIPPNITKIGEEAFSYATKLVSININASIKTLEKNIFKDSTQLKTVTLPPSLEVIKCNLAYQHYNVKAIESIVIPANVEVIDEYSFVSPSYNLHSSHDDRRRVNTIEFKGSKAVIKDTGTAWDKRLSFAEPNLKELYKANGAGVYKYVNNKWEYVKKETPPTSSTPTTPSKPTSSSTAPKPSTPTTPSKPTSSTTSSRPTVGSSNTTTSKPVWSSSDVGGVVSSDEIDSNINSSQEEQTSVEPVSSNSSSDETIKDESTPLIDTENSATTDQTETKAKQDKNFSILPIIFIALAVVVLLVILLVFYLKKRR